MADQEEINPYQLLDISLDASDADIKSAYRKLSLKVHPDRNRNNPDAGTKFHELTLAYELLLDPLRRTALDQTIRLKEEKKLRYQGFNKRRRDMVADLEARELEVKKSRVDKEQKEREVWNNNEKIMNEGRRLREQREKESRKHEEEEIAAAAASGEEEPPAIGDLDTTIRLKYPLLSQPNLTTADAIADLIRQFGEIDKDSIVLSIKSKASKKKWSTEESTKIGTALVPLKRIGDAFAAVNASGIKERGLQDVQVSWAGEGGREPPLIGWLKRQGKLGSNARSPASSPDALKGTSFASFPSLPQSIPQPTAPSITSTPGIDYESLTLMRLREAERARLEREILAQEANES